MALTMTQVERESFLADVNVAIISIPEEGRGPLTVPVWYNFVDGEIVVWTGGNSRKARLLRQAGRFSICVQRDQEPYKYVSAEGPLIGMEAIELESELKPLVYRYMGQERGDQFLSQLGGESAGTGDVLIRMKPERWLTTDYAKAGE